MLCAVKHAVANHDERKRRLRAGVAAVLICHAGLVDSAIALDIRTAAVIAADTSDVFHTARLATTRERETQSVESCAEAAAESALTLEDLSALALCRSPEAKAALARWLKSSAELAGRNSGYFPKINANGSSGGAIDRVEYARFPHVQTTRDATGTAGVAFTWLLYDFGARSARVSASRNLVEVAMRSHASAIQDVLFEVARRYYEYQGAQAALKASERTERTAQANLEIGIAIRKAGVGEASSQMLFESAKIRATSDRTQAQGAADIARAGVLAYAGFRPSDAVSIALAKKETSPDLIFKNQGLRSIVLEALGANQQIAAARSSLSAAEDVARAIAAQGLPTISMAVSGTQSYSLPGDMGSQTKTSSSAVVQLTIPIFDGFSQRSELEAARADVMIKKADLERTARDISLNAWQAFLALRNGVDLSLIHI